MRASPHVVVVGGGIAGCTVAIELADRAASVTLVERDQPGVGATGASAGMLAPQYEAHGPDDAFDFGVACREAYPAFVQRLESLTEWDVGLRTDGMMVANRTVEEEGRAGRALAFQLGADLRGEILSSRAARRLHPHLATDVPSWLWLPDEAQVDAQRLAVALGDAVRGAGVRLLGGAEVSSVTAVGARATGVRLTDGTVLGADAVVLAAGAWSAGIEGLPRRLPVRPVRGQMLRLLPDERLSWTLVSDHAAHYLVPRVNGSVLVGSTMEDAGFDDSVTEEGRATLVEAAVSLLPVLEHARIVEAWAGLRPISEDGWPVLGPEPDLDGLFYAAGHGRNGILFAPLVGRAVADLVVRGSSDVRWEPFRVGRFDRPA